MKTIKGQYTVQLVLKKKGKYVKNESYSLDQFVNLLIPKIENFSRPAKWYEFKRKKSLKFIETIISHRESVVKDTIKRIQFLIDLDTFGRNKK